MELKERIIYEAKRLLYQLGPAKTTMDMVARSCGISKRTLYEQFPDKHSLIRECIIYQQGKVQQEFQTIFETSANCFEALFLVFNCVRKHMNSMAFNFREEIKRHFPDIHAEFNKDEYVFIDGLSQVLQEAQKQGLVLPDIDTRIAAFLLISTLKNVHRNEQIIEMNLNQVDVFEAAFINFLRGAASIKGIEMIEEFIQNKNKTTT